MPEKSDPANAENRVEDVNPKLWAFKFWIFYPLQPFRRQMEHFLTDMSNRVEHQKQNQPAIEKWPFGFVFGVQLGLRQTRALIKT